MYGCSRRARVVAIASFALTHAMVAPSHADWKPDRNVEVISAAAAGGAADGTARIVQRLLQERKLLPATSVVVNKPGGQQTLAMTYLAQHPGDAHYVAIASTPLLSNHVTGASRQHYGDFTPLALLFTEHVALAVRADGAIRDARDLTERMKKDPGVFSFGVGTSIGGINHIGAALGLKAAGADIRRMRAVVFNSSSQAALAVMGGHLDVVASLVNVAVQQVEAGKMRALVVTAPRRLPGVLAGVPTWRELGLDAVTVNWRMVIGPRGLTPAQVAFWDAALARLTDSPEYREDLRRNHQEHAYIASSGMRRFLEEQQEQFRVVLAELGLAK